MKRRERHEVKEKRRQDKRKDFFPVTTIIEKVTFSVTIHFLSHSSSVALSSSSCRRAGLWSGGLKMISSRVEDGGGSHRQVMAAAVVEAVQLVLVLEVETLQGEIRGENGQHLPEEFVFADAQHLVVVHTAATTTTHR